MKSDDLAAFIEAGLSQREIGRRIGRSQASVKRWLRVHGMITQQTRAARLPKPERQSHCRVCGGTYSGTRRKRCPSCDTRVRRMRGKLAAIALLGGKCNRCGWTGLPAGFDFHHKNDDDKLFNIAQVANRAWSAIVDEVSKCELLCRVCHAIHHSKHEDNRLLAEIARADV